jgi:hypothetical protein
MERAEILMLKLLEQYRKKENPETLMLTLQQIQHELSLTGTSTPSVKERNKVSVVLPYRHKHTAADEKTAENGVKTVEILQVDESELEKELEEIKQSAEMKNEMGLKLRPPVQEQLEAKEESIPSLSSAVQFDPYEIEEIPTLATHISPNHTNSSSSSSDSETGKETSLDQSKELNEMFREPRKEVAQKLQDVPIKDLRKAIGINDRYLYINELFNGDEAMFERSVKTLNHFSILPEAEFWMQRELRIKLGWKEDHFLVQQFVQLVRRRFS